MHQLIRHPGENFLLGPGLLANIYISGKTAHRFRFSAATFIERVASRDTGFVLAALHPFLPAGNSVLLNTALRLDAVLPFCPDGTLAVPCQTGGCQSTENAPPLQRRVQSSPLHGYRYLAK